MNSYSLPEYRTMGYITATALFEGMMNSIPFRSPAFCLLKLISSLFLKKMLLKTEMGFILTDHNIEQIAGLYIERKVKVPEGAGFLVDHFRNDCVQSLKLSLQIIKELNQHHGTQVELCVVLDKSYNPGPIGFAAGGMGNESIILYSPNERVIDTIPEETSPEKLAKELSEHWKTITPRRKFVLAHEFSHIRHQDVLKLLAIKVVACVAAVILWLPAASLSCGMTAGLYIFSRCFVIQTGFSLLGILFARTVEMRADLDAMNTLGSSEGAISLLSALEKLDGSQYDVDHPSPSIRLQAANDWKKSHLLAPVPT